MEKGFVYLDEAVPGTRWDAKYFGSDNFVGEPIDGYKVNRVVGAREMAERLQEAANAAASKNLGLLLWDGYRPVRAVAHFLRWAQMSEDGRTKRAHYPNIDKRDIIQQGYVCEKSGHSRGGTIDLTLCDLQTGTPVDMGGIFDLMDITSHHGASGVSETAAKNRALLRDIMEKHGFAAYENEWWHYTLINEPYPQTYFDFPIK